MGTHLLGNISCIVTASFYRGNKPLRASTSGTNHCATIWGWWRVRGMWSNMQQCGITLTITLHITNIPLHCTAASDNTDFARDIQQQKLAEDLQTAAIEICSYSQLFTFSFDSDCKRPTCDWTYTEQLVNVQSHPPFICGAFTLSQLTHSHRNAFTQWHLWCIHTVTCDTSTQSHLWHILSQAEELLPIWSFPLTDVATTGGTKYTNVSHSSAGLHKNTKDMNTHRNGTYNNSRCQTKVSAFNVRHPLSCLLRMPIPASTKCHISTLQISHL